MLYAYMMFNSINHKEVMEVDHINVFDQFLSSFTELSSQSESQSRFVRFAVRAQHSAEPKLQFLLGSNGGLMIL